MLEVLDGRPSAEGIDEMARDAVEGNKDWMDLGDPAAVADFLHAAVGGDLSFPGVPEEDVAGHAFVVGGYLISRYRRDGQRWYEHLDDAWNAAVATPES